LAEEEEETKIYTIPLGRVHGVSHSKRAPYALKLIKSYVTRHMKVDLEDERIYISPEVNEVIWARGLQKPPPRIRVKVARFEDDEGFIVEVKLPEEE
jgi:large subunit ribosomal protein L31e